ncbi:MAG: hypothetical protein V1492_01550 [Candidatus Micrarchaeota archaeon]
MTEKTVAPPQGAKDEKKGSQGIIASVRGKVADLGGKAANYIRPKDNAGMTEGLIAQNSADMAAKLGVDKKIEKGAQVSLNPDEEQKHKSTSHNRLMDFTRNLVDDIKRKRNIADPNDGVILSEDFLKTIHDPEAVKAARGRPYVHGVRTPYEEMAISGHVQEITGLMTNIGKTVEKGEKYIGGSYQNPETLSAMTLARGNLVKKLDGVLQSKGEYDEKEFDAFELDIILTTLDSRDDWRQALCVQALLYASKNSELESDKNGDGNIGKVLGGVLAGLVETKTLIEGSFSNLGDDGLIKREPVCDWLKNMANKREIESSVISQTSIGIRDEYQAKDAAFRLISLISNDEPDTEKKAAERFEPIGKEKTKENIRIEFEAYTALKEFEAKIGEAITANKKSPNSEAAVGLITNEISGTWWGIRLDVVDRMKRVKALLKDARAGARLDNELGEKKVALEKNIGVLDHTKEAITALFEHEETVEKLKKDGAPKPEIDAAEARLQTFKNGQLLPWMTQNKITPGTDLMETLQGVIEGAEGRIEKTTAEIEALNKRIAVRDAYAPVKESLGNFMDTRKLNAAMATVDRKFELDIEHGLQIILDAKKRDGNTDRENLTLELKELQNAVKETRWNLYPWSKITEQTRLKLSRINGKGASRLDFLQALDNVREKGTEHDDIKMHRPDKEATWESLRKWVYKYTGMPISVVGSIIGLEVIGVTTMAVLAPHVALTWALYIAATNGAYVALNRFISNLKYWRHKHEMYRSIPILGRRPMGVGLNMTMLWAAVFIGIFNIYDLRHDTIKFMREYTGMQAAKQGIAIDGKDKQPVWVLATGKTEDLDKKDVEARYGVKDRENKEWLLNQPHVLRYFEKMTTGKDPVPVEKFGKDSAPVKYIWKINTSKADAFVAKLRALKKSDNNLVDLATAKIKGLNPNLVSEDDVHAREMGWVAEEFIFSRSIEDYTKKFNLSLSDAESLHKFVVKNPWISTMLERGNDEWQITNVSALLVKINSKNGNLEFKDLIANGAAVDPTLVISSINVHTRLGVKKLKAQENVDFAYANQEVIVYINEYKKHGYVINDMDGVLSNIKKVVEADKKIDTFDMDSSNFDPRYLTFMMETGLIGQSKKDLEADKIKTAAGSLSRSISEMADDLMKNLKATNEQMQKVKAKLNEEYIKPEKIRNTGIVKTAAGEYVIGEKDEDGTNFRVHVMNILKQVKAAEGQQTKADAKADQAARKAELVKQKPGEPQVEPVQKNVKPDGTNKKPNDKKPKKEPPPKKKFKA